MGWFGGAVGMFEEGDWLLVRDWLLSFEVLYWLLLWKVMLLWFRFVVLMIGLEVGGSSICFWFGLMRC